MTGPETELVNPDIKMIAEAVSEQVKYQIAVAGAFGMILIGMIGFFMKEEWNRMKADMKTIMVENKNMQKQHSALHTQVQLIGQEVSFNRGLEKMMTTLRAMGSGEPLDNENEE